MISARSCPNGLQITRDPVRSTGQYAIQLMIQYLLTRRPESDIHPSMITKELPIVSPPSDGRTFVNHDCWFQNTEGCIVVFVKGITIHSYDVDDEASARLVMVQLVELKVATQEEVARSFGVRRVTVYRQRRSFQEKGIKALVPKKRGPKGPRTTGGRKDKVIVKLKDAGESNRKIARRLGVSEFSIRTALKRLGYEQKLPVQQKLPITEAVPDKEETEAEDTSKIESSGDANAPVTGDGKFEREDSTDPSAEAEILAERSSDKDPSNRFVDRMLARMGLLHDAAPLFQTATAVQGAGLLLAIPILVAHGVFTDAMRVFHDMGPAFYGLRNTVMTLVLCFLRGINRPENLKEHSPASLGRVMGLDRAPEMKTLRRKIRVLAAQKGALKFIRLQLQRHLHRLNKSMLWLYVDGHVSVYSGKRKLKKHYATRLRLSVPSVLDYWVNDEKGDPLLVLTGRPRKGMGGVVEDAIKELRSLGEKRAITLVFDREGWSPALFARLDAMEGVRFVTYRKAKKGRKLPRLAADEFGRKKGKFDGEDVEYDLADKQIYIDYGARRKKKKRIVLRQVTRLCDTGKQTHVVTNDPETPALEIAYRMFGRWGQENFFKYMRKEKDFDGLVAYLMEEADTERLVSNPKRVKLNKELKKQRTELEDLLSEYGALAFINEEKSRPTMRGFKIANGKVGQEISRRQEIIKELDAKRRQTPAKIPSSSISADEKQRRAHNETRQLIHAFRMVAYRSETALRELLRSSYPRWRYESRTLIRTFLATPGDVEVNGAELKITLDEQSAPHRTLLLSHLCDELNSQQATFPGSDLVLHFAVRGAENGSGSG